jgi:hypothetical protein
MLSQRRRAQFEVIGLVMFEAVAVVALHRLAARPDVGIEWRDLGRWLTMTPVDQIVVSIVWLVALALAWWTLASTVLYVVVRARGLRRGARVAERLAFPMIRQVVDRAVTATLVTTALLGTAPAALAAEPSVPLVVQQAASEYEPRPAGAEDPDRGAGRPPSNGGGLPGPLRQAPDPVDPFSDESGERDGGEKENKRGDGQKRRGDGERRKADGPRERRNERDAERPRKAAREDDSADERDKQDRKESKGARDRKRSDDERRSDRKARDSEDRRARPGGGFGMPQPGGTYTVRVGDHLWKIATEVVSAHGGASGRRAVASYWAELVRVATPQLRSGDPNLIYPGETLELPPLGYGIEDGR